MSQDEKFMERCFRLALLGRGYNSPNPMVGAVVVHNGKIIGEGYHRQYGQAHAEVNAINSVKDKSLLKESIIYVNLEPCCHYGKTPPCAELLVKSQIKKCVISNVDSNPKVHGGGIRILEQAGIEVVSGVLEEEGRFLNRRFFCLQEDKRPFVILKYAQSTDGFMDVERQQNGVKKNYWITNDVLKVFVHKQRCREDAVLVGYNTVVNDNPSLTSRYHAGRNPVRVVFDGDLSLNAESNIFNKESKTIIFNRKENKTKDNLEYIKIEDNQSKEVQILNKLYERGISSLIVEGGKKTLEAFISQNLWNEAYILSGNALFGKGKKSPVISAELKKSTISAGDNRVDYFYNSIKLDNIK